MSKRAWNFSGQFTTPDGKTFPLVQWAGVPAAIDNPYGDTMPANVVAHRSNGRHLLVRRAHRKLAPGCSRGDQDWICKPDPDGDLKVFTWRDKIGHYVQSGYGCRNAIKLSPIGEYRCYYVWEF